MQKSSGNVKKSYWFVCLVVFFSKSSITRFFEILFLLNEDQNNILEVIKLCCLVITQQKSLII